MHKDTNLSRVLGTDVLECDSLTLGKTYYVLKKRRLGNRKVFGSGDVLCSVRFFDNEKFDSESVTSSTLMKSSSFRKGMAGEVDVAPKGVSSVSETKKVRAVLRSMVNLTGDMSFLSTSTFIPMPAVRKQKETKAKAGTAEKEKSVKAATFPMPDNKAVLVTDATCTYCQGTNLRKSKIQGGIDVLVCNECRTVVPVGDITNLD